MSRCSSHRVENDGGVGILGDRSQLTGNRGTGNITSQPGRSASHRRRQRPSGPDAQHSSPGYPRTDRRAQESAGMTQRAVGYEDCDIALESGRLRVRRWGAEDAPAVVCVPGLSANLCGFDRLAERLAGDTLQLSGAAGSAARAHIAADAELVPSGIRHHLPPCVAVVAASPIRRPAASSYGAGAGSVRDAEQLRSVVLRLAAGRWAVTVHRPRSRSPLFPGIGPRRSRDGAADSAQTRAVRRNRGALPTR